MNRKKVSNNFNTVIKSSFLEHFLKLNVSRIFLKCLISTKIGFVLSNLLHAKLCLFVSGATYGNLLAYAAA